MPLLKSIPVILDKNLENPSDTSFVLEPLNLKKKLPLLDAINRYILPISPANSK